MAIEKELFNRKIEGEDNVLGIVPSLLSTFSSGHFQIIFVQLKPFQTRLFRERNSEQDRGGFFIFTYARSTVDRWWLLANSIDAFCSINCQSLSVSIRGGGQMVRPSVLFNFVTPLKILAQLFKPWLEDNNHENLAIFSFNHFFNL
jgi:hypothetical protein